MRNISNFIIIVIFIISLGFSYNAVAQCNCDPLPTPGPGETTETVSNTSGLQNAINTATGPKTIWLQTGTYSVDTSGWITVTNPDITIRSLTGNRDDVIIQGVGMGPKPGFGIQVYESRVTIADLTIRDVGYHTIQVNKTVGRTTDDCLFHNIRCIDAGQQLFKSSGGDMYDGIIQCSTFEYTTTLDSGCYTNGIDLVGTHGWIIRDNIIRNIKGNGCLAGPAILIWPASGTGLVCSDSIVERNLVIDCDMGIAFGNPSASGVNHTGGIIKNNFIKGYSGSDFGIAIIKSSDAKVINNTIYSPGFWLYSIEVQYTESTNCLIQNNLHDEPMWLNRFGTNNPILVTNLDYSSPSIFVDAARGDLHLVSGTVPSIIDAGTAVSDRTMDIDCQGISSQPDLGADEYRLDVPVTGRVFLYLGILFSLIPALILLRIISSS